MNITKASLFGILAAATLLHAGTSWTLEACLKQAAEKSLSLETAKLREQQAQVNVKQAKIGHYPTVSASIQNTLYDHPFVDQEDHYRLNLGLNGSVTLWDGGATSLNVEAKELSREAAELSTLQTKRTVQENVLNAYMSLLLAKENLHTADYAVEVAQAEFEYFTNLYGVGSVTKKDLTQSEASVLQKQAAKITAELKVSTARTTLRQLLELPETEEFDVSAPEINMNNPDSLPPLPEYGELQARIRAAHPGLKSDSISVKAAQKNTKVAGKNSSISVTLGANSSTGLQAWESKGYKDQLKYGWQNSLTLGISIPIIDAGATANKVLLAQVNEAETQVGLQETAKNLENSIEKLYLNALSADLQWKAAVLQVAAEQEALKVAEEQRRLGALTYTDYLNQKNSLESAQVALNNAKYTSLLSRKLLDLYQGLLDQ